MKCTLSNATVHYETVGEGKPILMLHPWMADSRVMYAACEPLFRGRSGWKRVYLDLPGMGKTHGVESITCQDQVLDLVVEFADAVIGAQSFAVAGASYGGYLALGLIHRRSESIDGALLIAPMMTADSSKRIVPSHITLVTDESLRAGLTPAQAEHLSKPIVVQSRKIVDWFVDISGPPEEAPDQVFLSRLLKQHALSHEVEVLSHPFAAPALVLLGRQDSVVGYRNGLDLLENYPRGTFVVLDRAGHFLEAEQEHLFNSLAIEWLDRVEEFVATRSGGNSAGGQT